MIRLENLEEISAVVSEASSRLTAILGQHVELRIVRPDAPNIKYPSSYGIDKDNKRLANDIMTICCREFGITMEQLTGAGRKRICADTRKAAAHLMLSQLVTLTVKEAGLLMGLDHSTIIYNRDAANDLLLIDPKFKVHYGRCKDAYVAMIMEEGKDDH